jgi:hypothetical protein
MNNQRILHIGIVIDSIIGSKYDLDLVKWCLARDDLKLQHLIVNGLPNVKEKSRFRKGISAVCGRIFLRVLAAVEDMLLRTDRRYRDHGARFDISKLVHSVVPLSPAISGNGRTDQHRGNKLDADTLELIRSMRLDLLVVLGRTDSIEGLSDTARLGAISVHHGSNKDAQSGPSGFWEVFLKSETTEFTIRLDSDATDGGTVLRRGRYSTKYFWKYNEASIRQKSTYHLKRLIEEIASTGCVPTPFPHLPYSGPSFGEPTALESVLYALRVGWHVLSKVNRKILGVFGRHRRWRVAYALTDWTHTVMWRSIEIENPPLHFLADPFVMSKDERHYCFVEDFSYKIGRADIAVYELEEQGAKRLGTALTEPFHLSFPYIFHYEGQLYMCPETAESNEIRVYRCLAFPLRWSLEKSIMNGINAADTMLFESGGRWWMLTNVDPVGDGDYASELWIFYAESPLATDWKPHAQNPVLIDASRARNAGMFKHGDKLYRVSQGQGFDFYGRRSFVNEIVVLTPTSYEEACVAAITPDFKPGAKGTHHLHSNGAVTVFDYISHG